MKRKRDIFHEKYIGKDYVALGSDLILDREEAAKNISRRARRAIERARKVEGFEIKKEKGDKKDLDRFRTIWYDPEDQELGDGGFQENQHVYFGYLDGELVSGIVVSEVGSNLFLHFNGANEEAKKLQIPSLMIWHIVDEFHDTDFKFLDIGCSFRPALQHFFKNWATYEYPIIYHPPHLTPTIEVTPFDNQSFANESVGDVDVEKELSNKFGDKPYSFVPAGKYAIFAALKHLNLKENDEVYITTTTGSPYISSCVTTAIESVCNWERELSKNTKAIFVIHEFGFVHPDIKKLKETSKEKNIPLVEDCAYSWESADAGTYGDYVIYSLPKFFPVQYGGILVGAEYSDENMWNELQCLDVGKREVMKEQLSPYIGEIESALEKRRKNYLYLEELTKNEGYEPFFSLEEGESPGAYVLKMNNKEQVEKACSTLPHFGIECGAFHHNDAVFLPIHQNLSKKHLDYIFGALRSILREDGWVLPPEHFIKINEEKKDRNDHPEKRWEIK